MSPIPNELDPLVDVLPHVAAHEAPSAIHHRDAEAVCFWVPVADGFVGASIRSAMLRYRFNREGEMDDPLEIYARHAAELGAAVQRRVAQGSIEPVMLREFDLKPEAVSAESKFG